MKTPADSLPKHYCFVSTKHITLDLPLYEVCYNYSSTVYSSTFRCCSPNRFSVSYLLRKTSIVFRFPFTSKLAPSSDFIGARWILTNRQDVLNTDLTQSLASANGRFIHFRCLAILSSCSLRRTQIIQLMSILRTRRISILTCLINDINFVLMRFRSSICLYLASYLNQYLV